MQTVTRTRRIDAPPDAVRHAMTRIEPFVAAAGFEEVAVADNTIRVANQVGPVTIELTLELVDDTEAALKYVQSAGIFEEMQTTYTVEEIDGGSKVIATTEFALDVAIIGEFLDATVIKRQRRAELDAQLDWLERTV